MKSLTRALALEFAPIRVNAVAARLVRTTVVDDVPKANERHAVLDRARRSLPDRSTGEAADIAKNHLRLMDDKFTTGTVIIVDGAAVFG